MKETNKKDNDYKGAIEALYKMAKEGIEPDFDMVQDHCVREKLDFLCGEIRNNDIFCDYVYAFFFEEQHSVYVGRTIHLRLREQCHRTNASSSVFRFAKQNNVEVPPMKILERCKTTEEGVQKEDYYCKKLKSQGWSLINVAETGNVGSCSGRINAERWDYNKCYDEAKKYKDSRTFKKESAKAYCASARHGWLKDFFWLSGRKNRNPTYKGCEEIARKYETLKDFRTHDRRVYRLSVKYD